VSRELGLLVDPDYLVSDVLGKAEFDWDFRCLDAGFMDLVRPYLAEASGVDALYNSCLDALGAYAGARPGGLLFVEFGHFATVINDFYTFHPLFLQHEVPVREAARLTQLRYAGQYLNNYPRHLLVQDRFDLPDAGQSLLHEQFMGITVNLGISRGAMLNWLRHGIGQTRPEHYLQNAINGMENYISLPIITALVLGGETVATVNRARQLLQLLCLSIKLRIERDALAAGSTFDGASLATRTLLALPGFAVTSQAIRGSGPATSLYDCYEQCQAASGKEKAAAIRLYDEHIGKWLGRFHDEIGAIASLREWAKALARALATPAEVTAGA